MLSPRRSIEWVRNIDGRQDKTAPGDPVELGLVAKMNRAVTSNGITSLAAKLGLKSPTVAARACSRRSF